MNHAQVPLQGAWPWPQHKLPGRVRPHGCDAQARPGQGELQPSGVNVALISHIKKRINKKEAAAGLAAFRQ